MSVTPPKTASLFLRRRGFSKLGAGAAYGVNGSDRERKLELQGQRWRALRWGSWCQAVLGQESRDRIRCRRGLDPAHRPTS